MVSFNKLTRTLAGIAAAALIVPLAACGGSGNGGTATAEGIPAKGADDGTEITLWTRSPLERQAKNVVEAYNKSHKNQVKLEIIPNDDMEGKVGGASQTDSLPDILAGDVVPYSVLGFRGHLHRHHQANRWPGQQGRPAAGPH